MESKVIYVNTANVAASPMDFHILMRSTSPIIDEMGKVSGLQYSDTVDVVMSVQHAKILMEALMLNIAEYEKKYGIIDVTKIKSALSSNQIQNV